MIPENAEDFRTIWLKPGDESVVQIIDQRLLPHKYQIHDLHKWQDGVTAIADMYVRGAPLIGATAAWSLYLATLVDGDTQQETKTAADVLLASRPTAVNLRWAIERVVAKLQTATSREERTAIARKEAEDVCNEDIEISRGIGNHGLRLIEEISAKKNGETVNVLTHCNAGSLATIKLGHSNGAGLLRSAERHQGTCLGG